MVKVKRRPSFYNQNHTPYLCVSFKNGWKNKTTYEQRRITSANESVAIKDKAFRTMGRTIRKAISKELVELCLLLWAFNIRRSLSNVLKMLLSRFNFVCARSLIKNAKRFAVWENSTLQSIVASSNLINIYIICVITYINIK